MIQLKRYNDGSDGVGEWNYELNLQTPLEYSLQGLEEWRQKVVIVAAALSVRNFFQFETLRVERWCRIGSNATQEFIALQRLIPSDLLLNANVNGDGQTVFSLPEKEGLWFPVFAVMEGQTHVKFPDHEVVVDGLASVRVLCAGILAFTLVVDCDVYLDYDLLGKEQPALAALNHPILEEAIGGLATVLGVDPYAENTKYAAVTDKGMQSLFEEEGMDELIDAPESWIRRAWN
ncbi:MAG: hypothetical protein IPN95_21855 [Bacteroidetes bacterium]|jgi:hypothetical protein|nr:hypothetical protein [Bacteroidota bacterium]